MAPPLINRFQGVLLGAAIAAPTSSVSAASGLVMPAGRVTPAGFVARSQGAWLLPYLTDLLTYHDQPDLWPQWATCLPPVLRAIPGCPEAIAAAMNYSLHHDSPPPVQAWADHIPWPNPFPNPLSALPYPPTLTDLVGWADSVSGASAQNRASLNHQSAALALAFPLFLLSTSPHQPRLTLKRHWLYATALGLPAHFPRPQPLPLQTPWDGLSLEFLALLVGAQYGTVAFPPESFQAGLQSGLQTGPQSGLRSPLAVPSSPRVGGLAQGLTLPPNHLTEMARTAFLEWVGYYQTA